ncbi:MAG: hypothetical protein AB7O97_21535 [Planctomycetota bacterium]
MSSPRILPILAAVCATLTIARHPSAQQPDDDAANAALQERFLALDTPQQLQVLGRIEARLRGSDVPALQRIAALAQETRDAPPLRPRTYHDPMQFAPVAPRRTVVARGTPQHAAVRRMFPPVRVLHDLHPTVVYDWHLGAPARSPDVPSPPERFADLCAGYPPDADAAIVAVLLRLDRDGDQREFARWCEQLYADRDGAVFDGVTLYEAWYSGDVVEVPDVDAIAFARQVLDTRSFLSPIPDGARRARLYDRIRAAFKKHREYRTLLQAAAATFVTASPELDTVYLPLVDRMHLIWAECGHDLDCAADWLTADDRSVLLDELDERIRESADAVAAAQASKDEKLALAAAVKAVCAAELR